MWAEVISASTSPQETQVRSNILDPIKLDEDPSQKEMEALINLYTMGQLQKALSEANKLLLEYPRAANIYNIIGAINQGLGNLEEAIKAYKKAISIKPDYAEAHNNMGNAFKHQGKLEQAIKAYKKAVIKEIKLTGGMHRYIPVLAKNAGFKNISEKIVKHHPRKHGKTKYGADRFIKGFLDLITLWFIHKFGKRPMHFFGLIGTFMLMIGFFFSLFLGIEKLFIETSGRLITERPEFYIALATMIIGSQFFLAGFLGEIILRNKKIEKQYIISEKIINE